MANGTFSKKNRGYVYIHEKIHDVYPQKGGYNHLCRVVVTEKT